MTRSETKKEVSLLREVILHLKEKSCIIQKEKNQQKRESDNSDWSDFMYRPQNQKKAKSNQPEKYEQ